MWTHNRLAHAVHCHTFIISCKICSVTLLVHNHRHASSPRCRCLIFSPPNRNTYFVPDNSHSALRKLLHIPLSTVPSSSPCPKFQNQVNVSVSYAHTHTLTSPNSLSTPTLTSRPLLPCHLSSSRSPPP